MNLLTVLLIVLVVLVLSGGGWGYRVGWYGSSAPYYPAGFGIVGLVLVVLLILALLGRI